MSQTLYLLQHPSMVVHSGVLASTMSVFPFLFSGKVKLELDDSGLTNCLLAAFSTFHEPLLELSLPLPRKSLENTYWDESTDQGGWMLIVGQSSLFHNGVGP